MRILAGTQTAYARQAAAIPHVSGPVAQMSEEYARLRCWYGDPAYGSWPESAKSEQPVKQLVLALMRGEAELIGERPILRKPAAAEANSEEAAA